MDIYLIVKTLHILSSTILFGTGIGIAFFMLRSYFTQDVHEKLYAARNTVLADYIFTFPAVILQPVTGAWLVMQGGYDWTDLWLVITYAIYMIAGLCWLPVMQTHYMNRPYSDDVTTVEGTLDVMCRQPLKFLSPIMRLMGQVPTHNEKDVRVTVEFKSDPDTKAFHFKRTFHFKDAKPYVFHSRMMQVKDNEVIEVMRFGLGWKMLYLWDGEKVVLQHRGYALHLLGYFMPVPLTLFMGKGYAEETAVDDNTFDMITHITHPWWGRVYEYKGRFKVVEGV